jgi:hypothetical protein
MQTSAWTASSVAPRGEQLAFRWTDRDFRLVAASGGVDPELAEDIWHAYGSLIRPREDSRTSSSVVYLNDHDFGVILLRLTDGGPGNDQRDQRSRLATYGFLLRDLDIAGRVAVGMCTDPGACGLEGVLGRTDPSGALFTLEPQGVLALASASPGLLPERLDQSRYSRLLAALVARLLHAPTRKLAIELPDPPYETPAVLPARGVAPQAWMLWGLWATVRRMVQDRQGRPWQASFSTLEQPGEIQPKLLPQVIFQTSATHLASPTYQYSHLSVSLAEPYGHEPPPPQMYCEAAQILVEAYLRGVEEASHGGDANDAFADIDRAIQRSERREDRVTLLLDMRWPTEPQPGTYSETAPLEQRLPVGAGQPGTASGYDGGAVEAEGRAAEPSRPEPLPELIPQPAAEEVATLLAQLRDEVARLTAVTEHLQELPEHLQELLHSSPTQDVPSAGLRPERFPPLELLRPFGTGTETTRWANALYALVALLCVTLLVLVFQAW